MSRLKDLLPPLLYTKLHQSSLRRYGWFGDFDSWESAAASSVGYESDLIIQKVLDATLKVKNGEYPYERDSVLFHEIQYDWPLLSALMWVAARNEGKLNVLDFGGSLGSTYWQNRKFLETLPELKWNIVEQSNYVDMGRKYLENEKLKFYYDFESCQKENEINLVLLSSVINYIKDPFSLLGTLCDLKVKHMIIERIPFIERGTDRITIQRVPPKIYKASYPAWFFDKKKFLGFIEKKYNILEIYSCGINLNLKSELLGIILTTKNP